MKILIINSMKIDTIFRHNKCNNYTDLCISLSCVFLVLRLYWVVKGLVEESHQHQYWCVKDDGLISIVCVPYERFVFYLPAKGIAIISINIRQFRLLWFIFPQTCRLYVYFWNLATFHENRIFSNCSNIWPLH